MRQEPKKILFVICHRRDRGIDFFTEIERSLGRSLKEEYRVNLVSEPHALYGASSYNTSILYTPGYKDLKNIIEIENTIKYAELKPLAI